MCVSGRTREVGYKYLCRDFIEGKCFTQQFSWSRLVKAEEGRRGVVLNTWDVGREGGREGTDGHLVISGH